MESGGGREQSRPLTAEEEALKRNTDCVYFLASPLTCKKGTECEYRHSEGARVNPRDCWYWLNGNCLNPKCMFRHPPLDGLIGMLGTTELAPPPSQTVALTHVPAAHGPAGFSLNKQNVPCYYFQKGHCLKGDRCPFLHGPQQRDNSVPQQYKSPPDPVSPLKKESWCLEEHTSQQSICKADVDETVDMPLAPVKPAGKSENVLNNGFAIKETVSPYPSEDGLPRFPESNVPVSSGIAPGWPRSRQSQHIDDYLQNAREADEFLRESSPGFDVLVNNNLEDSEYFGGAGDFEREPVQDARNLNHVSDFDYHHSDYESVPSFERDQYNGVGVHDRYGRLDNRYSWEQQRTTSERILERASMHEKKMLQGEERYHDIAAVDLRHRLLKQRRLNGSKSTFSPDHCGRLYRRHNYFVDEERYHAHHACRGHQRFPVESSISSRLQGRITLPARSSPDRPIDLQSERNRDKGRHQERSSPVRPVNYKGRHHDKIKRRPVFSDGRNAGVQPIGREEVDPLNFAGPKCLAELKGAKLSENLQDQKKIKLAKPLGHQESDGFLSFEGPKPLSVILKRKRENAPGNGANCCNGYKNTERDNVGGIGSSVLAATEREDNYTANCSKDSKVAGVNEEKEVGIIPIEGEELPNDGQTSAGGNTHEVEDGMTAGATDDQELENYGHRDGESDYEEVEDEEFKPEDDENTCQEDEEDDEDDFAKKVGVMFS